MKKILFHSFACFLLLIIHLLGHAQPRSIPPDLANQLSGMSNLEKIMQTVFDYYQKQPPTIKPLGEADDFEKDPLQSWARWAYLQSSRLDGNGNLTPYPILNYEAAKNLPVVEQKDPGLTQNAANGSWTFIGPSSSSYGPTVQNYLGLGRVDRIAFHPTDPNTIYLGTPSGGLWRTTNDGTSWTLLTKYLPSPGISGVVVSYSNANIIYILTGAGDGDGSGYLVNDMGYVRRSVGVLKSYDGGTTWYETGDMPGTDAQTTGYQLAQNPLDANELMAATSDGLFRTTNAGSTWTQVRTGKFWDVVYRPNSSTYIYAAGSGSDRFIRSTNGGDTWSNAITYSPGTPSATGRGHLAVAPSNSTVVYILWGPGASGGVFKGLYKSTDYGASFTRQATSPNVFGNDDDGGDDGDQSGYDIGLAVKPSNSTNIVTAGTTLWRSTNSGTTLTKLTSYNEGGSFAYIHPDVHYVAYHPTSGKLYAATDGGIYRSSDDGSSWTDISAGVETTQFYHGAAFEGDVNLFLGGSQDNGIKYRGSATSNFRHIICCDGFDTKFYPNNSAKGYASMNKSVFRLGSMNGGASGISPFKNGKWFSNIATHPSNGSIVYVGTDSFYRSDNEGVAWAIDINVDAAWALSSCPSNTTRVYAAGGSSPWASTGTIRRSDDQGATWSTISGSGLPSSSNKITDIGVRPNNSTNVWITYGGFSDGNKVFRTTTGDQATPTWINMSGTLPNVPVNCVVVDANNNAYIGTDIGVYFRSTAMSDWVPFYNFLPRVPVTDLLLNETAGRIKAVTFGFGLWESDVYSTCDADVVLNGSYIGYKAYQAGSTISSTGIVYGGIMTEVFFKAGNYVVLQPGFEARDENSVFRAYIGPCGGGIPTAAPIAPVDLIEITNESMVPFAHISSTSTSGNAIKVQVDVAGPYKLTLHTEDGNTVSELKPMGTMAAGSHEINSSFQKESGKIYYLKLWKEDKLVDMKEL